MPSSTASARRAWWLAALAVAVLSLHGLLLFIEHVPATRRLWGDEGMYADLAERAARGAPAEIELLWPPLYPRLLAWAARLGPLSGEGLAPGAARPARLAVALGQFALLLGAAWALHVFSARVTGSRPLADLAAALLLLDPQRAAFTYYLWPELPHLAAWLGALALLATAPAEPRARTLRVVLAGVLLGLAVLLKSLLTPFLPVVALAWVLARPPAAAPRPRTDTWLALAQAMLMLATAGVVVTPTLIANGVRTGTWVVADSLRFNMWVGLNERSSRNLVGEIVGDEFARWHASADTFAGRERVLDAKLRALVHARGGLALLRAQLGRQYRRLFAEPSFLSDQFPGQPIALQGYGYVAPPTWATTLLRQWQRLHYALLLVAACWGAALLWVRLGAQAGPARAWLATVTLFLAYNLALFLLLHVKTRYRVQFLPVLDLYAGTALAGQWSRSGGPQPPGWVRLTALAAALLGLALAFVALPAAR
jgi:hypothetical protein